MSVVTTGQVLAGVPLVLLPPRSGLYFSSVAIYNPLPVLFTVQSGPNQTNLSPQSAQLFEMASSGSPPVLQAAPSGYLYGTLLGTVQAVWYEPGEATGSYPVPLGVSSSPVTISITSPAVGTTISTPNGYVILPVGSISVIIQLKLLFADAGDQGYFTVTGATSGALYGTTAIQTGLGPSFVNVAIPALNPSDAQLLVTLVPNLIPFSSYSWTFPQSPVAQVAG